MRFGALRSPKLVILVCLVIMAALVFFAPPPPAKTLVFTGEVAAIERDPRSGALVAMEIHAGEAVLLVNMNVAAATAAPAPSFQQGEAVTLKVAAPHVDKTVPGVVLADYLANLTGVEKPAGESPAKP